MKRTASTVLGLLVMMGAVRADAQTIRTLGDDRVAVKAEGAAIGDLITRLAPLSTLKFIALDPADRAVRVTIDADDIAPLDAIVVALKASGLDYAMTGTRLIAGRAKKALENGGPVSWASTSTASTFTSEQPLPAAAAAEPESAAPSMTMDGPAEPHGAAGASPTFTSADEFGRNIGVPSVPFVVHEDSAVVTLPGFVPYKLRPEVKNRRLFGNIADIP